MILAHVLLLVILVAAVFSKPTSKKPGNIPAAQKRTPAKTGLVHKVADLNAKAPMTKKPVQRPVAKKPAIGKVNAVGPKPGAASKSVVAKKPAPVVAKRPGARIQPGTNNSVGNKTAVKSTKIPSQESGQVARSKSNLEAAMAYMKAQTPIDKSGDKRIEDLLASPSEAQQVEPYNPQKFLQARTDKINERNQWPETTKAQTGAAYCNTPPFWIISFVVATILIS